MMRRSVRMAGHIAGIVVLVTGALGVVVLGAGCQRVLFPEDAPRTQFETHDRLRNRYAPLHDVDEFGRQQPALRSRLSPTQS